VSACANVYYGILLNHHLTVKLQRGPPGSTPAVVQDTACVLMSRTASEAAVPSSPADPSNSQFESSATTEQSFWYSAPLVGGLFSFLKENP
jgi:hypothetical protein